MEYLNYLIYPIAGLLCLLAIGGLGHKHPVVIIASLVSLGLNGYAIIKFVWWPIPVSIASDFLFKALFGDPGAKPGLKGAQGADAIDVYLLGAIPLVMTKLKDPIARLGAQIFVLGMVDMKRSAENLSFDDFVGAYDAILARHDLSSPAPTPEFVRDIADVASEKAEVAHLMKEGAMSIKGYVVDRDTEAVADLARAIAYAEQNKRALASIL